MTDIEQARECDVERVTRAIYEGWPITVVSQYLSELFNLPIGAVVSWEQSLAAGCDHTGLRRMARSALAAMQSTIDAAIRGEREVTRLKAALGEICKDSNPDWTEKRVYPADVLDDIHTIAVEAFYHRTPPIDHAPGETIGGAFVEVAK